MVRLLCAVLIFTTLGAAAQEKPEGLFINSKAPDFKAKDQNGKEVELKDIRKKSPVVLIFYRGYWCPYCTRELQHLQDSLTLITGKGAEVIAITSENADGVAKTIDNTKVTFPIIIDADLKIMKAYDVAYQVDDKTISRYKMANIDLAANNGQKGNAIYLPVPAVFIVGKDGEVKYRFFDPDYKNQAPIEEILNNLIGLK